MKKKSKRRWEMFISFGIAVISLIAIIVTWVLSICEMADSGLITIFAISLIISLGYFWETLWDDYD